MKIKKYNDTSKNISGKIIKNAREKKNLSKTELSKQLELYGIYLHRNEIYRIENNLQLVKDFELVALAEVLDIDLNKFKKIIK